LTIKFERLVNYYAVFLNFFYYIFETEDKWLVKVAFIVDVFYGTLESKLAALAEIIQLLRRSFAINSVPQH